MVVPIAKQFYSLAASNNKRPSIPKENNFDILRFFLAFSVFMSHLYDLTLCEQLKFLRYIFYPDFAVKSFFVISGFLIFMSYENTSSLRQYFLKRARRIYPAYITVIVLCALLGVFLTSLPLQAYFTSREFIKYVFFNFTFLNFIQPNLPGVFTHNINGAVDGALWTIKIEVLFYLSVPIITIFFRRINKIIIFSAFYILSYTYCHILLGISQETGKTVFAELARQLPGQLCYFLSGTILYYFFDYFRPKYKIIFPVSVLLYALVSFLGIDFLKPVLLGFIIISFAFIDFGAYNFGKYGDFSYGLYIFHFPIIQILYSLGLFSISPQLAACFALIAALVSAYLSWNIVEARFLKRKLHLQT